RWGPPPPGRGRARAVHAAAGERRADDLDVEAPAGDLDGVGLLDSLVLVLSGRWPTHPLLQRERLEPALVLEQVAAGLAVGPLLGLQQRDVEGDQGLEPLDLV